MKDWPNINGCEECATLRAEMERYEAALRRIAGELGEFADADGETMVKKIIFFREEGMRLRTEALNIDREDVGRIMHESWTRTKRAQGYHHQSECCAMDRYESNGACPKCHSDLIPWEQLPEVQKDINRHAFDDILAWLKEGR